MNSIRLIKRQLIIIVSVVSILLCSGCGRPPEIYNPFRVPRQEFYPQLGRIAIVPMKFDLEISHYDVIMTVFDSLIAKELGAKNVATRIGKIEYDETVLKKLGIDIVIHPEAAAAGYISELITKPEVLDLAFISRGQAEIMELEITAKSKIAGKKVKEIEHPQGSAIIAVYENDNLIIPDKDTKLRVGSKILILAKREIAEEVRKSIM